MLPLWEDILLFYNLTAAGFEGANKYEVKTGKEGQVMFYAKEDNDCCTRMVCGNSRPFEMNIMNTQVSTIQYSSLIGGLVTILISDKRTSHNTDL